MSTLVDGYDAAFWNESYKLLRDAVIEHLGRFVADDDVAEEAIVLEAIERAGAALRDGAEGADARSVETTGGPEDVLDEIMTALDRLDAEAAEGPTYADRGHFAEANRLEGIAYACAKIRERLDALPAPPGAAPEESERERFGWAVERGVTCVVCPDCAFTFDATHTSEPDGDRYDCPNCGAAPEPATDTPRATQGEETSDG